MHRTYAIHKLPQDCDHVDETQVTRKLAALYKEGVRSSFPGENMILQAPKLLASPEAVRLSLRNAHVWICVAPNAKTGENSLEKGSWVGMYSLRGPLQPGQSSFFDSASGLSMQVKYWRGSRLFVQEQHRNIETFTGLRRSMEEFVRGQQQVPGNIGRVDRVRFAGRETSGAMTIYEGETEMVEAIRPLTYREVLEEDESLPATLTDTAPASIMDSKWTLFEERFVAT
ncbi:hypothetical protein MBLNU230_g7139t1 [Neophaeotheca triangularis]